MSKESVDVKFSNRAYYCRKRKCKRKVSKQKLHIKPSFSMTNRTTQERFGERHLSKTERRDMQAHIDRLLDGGVRWASTSDPGRYYVERVLPWEELVKCERNVLVNIRTSIEPKNRFKDGNYEPYNATWFYSRTSPYKPDTELANLDLAERCLRMQKFGWRNHKGYRHVGRPHTITDYRWREYSEPKKRKRKYIRDDSLLKVDGRFSGSEKYRPIKARDVQSFMCSDDVITTPQVDSYRLLRGNESCKSWYRNGQIQNKREFDDIMRQVEHIFDVEVVFLCNLGKATEEMTQYTGKPIGPKYYNSKKYELDRQEKREMKSRSKEKQKHRNKVEEQIFSNNLPLQIRV